VCPVAARPYGPQLSPTLVVERALGRLEPALKARECSCIAADRQRNLSSAHSSTSRLAGFAAILFGGVYAFLRELRACTDFVFTAFVGGLPTCSCESLRYTPYDDARWFWWHSVCWWTMPHRSETILRRIRANAAAAQRVAGS